MIDILVYVYHGRRKDDYSTGGGGTQVVKYRAYHGCGVRLASYRYRIWVNVGERPRLSIS